MTLKTFEIVSIVLSAFVGGMFWGPWLALSRSFRTFTPEVFLAIVHRMGPNMGSVMTILMPTALVSIVPVLFLSYNARHETFFLNLMGLTLFLVALLVTMIVEVPIVMQFGTWTVSTLPADWQRLRDRWGAFHVIRVGSSVVGLVLLVVGAVCY